MIDQFAYTRDTYEYNDIVDDRETNIRGIAESIENGQDSGARAYLNSFVQESDDLETVAQAKKLLKQLQEYKPLAKVEEMVEENYNQIDNQLSNIPPAGDEKNAMPQEKAVHIEERKKTRSRISMKEKLAEKRAEIAGKDAKSCEEVKKPPSIGVDD